jgi:hypothetical protein
MNIWGLSIIVILIIPFICEVIGLFYLLSCIKIRDSLLRKVPYVTIFSENDSEFIHNVSILEGMAKLPAMKETEDFSNKLVMIFLVMPILALAIIFLYTMLD